jgi:hypothetical protein
LASSSSFVWCFGIERAGDRDAATGRQLLELLVRLAVIDDHSLRECLDLWRGGFARRQLRHLHLGDPPGGGLVDELFIGL